MAPPINCSRCKVARANVKRSKTSDCLCKECFFYCFETEIHETIVRGKLFKPGDVVAIGASGGKDSTVLAYIMKLLNKRHNYGLNLVLLSIDEGITGYRDDSLETVKQNGVDYALPLTILSYQDLYGWTMDEIVQATGLKNNCTFCGVFRRQALDRGASLLKCNLIATGHNADDIGETILMNILRGDIARLGRSTNIMTSGGGTESAGEDWGIPRCKPFKYTYEKEIVLYARFKNLLYFSTECIYSPNAYRGHVRVLLKELEKIRPSAILDIIHSGECLQVRHKERLPQKGNCARCGFISSQRICKACVLLEGLNTGRPKLGISKSSRIEGLKRDENKNQMNGKNCGNCQCRGEDAEDQLRIKMKDEKLCNEDLDPTSAALLIGSIKLYPDSQIPGS